MQEYYRETLFSRFITAIFTVVIGWLLYSLLHQVFVGPLGSRPASNQFLLVMILFFIVLAVNFSRLSIVVNSQGVMVGYGVLKHRIPWDNIGGCYTDETSAVMYGGFGIRLGRVKGKWRIVYNVIGGPRVVLQLKRGWYREFVFSTKNPEAIMGIIRKRLNEPH